MRKGRLKVCILFHLFSSIVRPAAAAGRIFQLFFWHVFFFGSQAAGWPKNQPATVLDGVVAGLGKVDLRLSQVEKNRN